MFDHPLSRVYRIHCILIHLICQLSQQNAKEPYLRVYWQKNSTASLKNSTDVSAPSARFSNMAHTRFQKSSLLIM